MTTIQAIKQLEERNVASEITHMVWSDRMDLVAIANNKGELTLYRLSWTKAWTLLPPKETVTITALSWRPDGKIIAVAYTSCEIHLIKVENKDLLHTITLNCKITCLTWAQERSHTPKPNEKPAQKHFSYENTANMIQEPKNSTFDSTETNIKSQKINILQDQTDFNLILAGNAVGQVFIEIFGCFSAAILTFPSSEALPINSIQITEDLSKIIVATAAPNLKIHIFDADILKKCTNQLFQLAHKQLKMSFLLNYLDSTIEGMKESYETILLEMDEKLASYAEKVPAGGVVADFLELLMFGQCSEAMRTFLLNDLTRKRLEKFGQNIELSYTNIEKLLVNHVMKFGQNLTFHLTELRGMARFGPKFGALGLESGRIEEGMRATGAFLLKCAEMQQVMTAHAHNSAAFFRWLYLAIANVMEVPLPLDVPKMTQQDVASIADFLQNFDDSNSKFIMERLGQYLANAALIRPIGWERNDWVRFLDENHCLKTNAAILEHSTSKSLIQQYNVLRKVIEEVFVSPKSSIDAKFRLEKSLDLNFPLKTSSISCINVGSYATLVALVDTNAIYLLQFELNQLSYLRATKLGFENKVFDAKFYTNGVLSVIYDDSLGSVLTQMPINNEILASLKKIDWGEAIGGLNELETVVSNVNLRKVVEGMQIGAFAVSGSRRVGIVLSENRRKVRLYEMEAEEEEEEDADMTSVSKDNSLV